MNKISLFCAITFFGIGICVILIGMVTESEIIRQFLSPSLMIGSLLILIGFCLLSYYLIMLTQE